MASAEYAVQQNIAAGLLAGSVTRDRRARWWRRTGAKSRGFRYETAEGRRIADEDALERIRLLVIPPAWREVRISPSPRSALQAIGVDKLGRVQRIYHPSFVARRARRKYEKVERFGEALPALRRKANEDIAREGLGKERVLAVVVRLINDLYFRVGSEESVKRYRTYGVTTLRNRRILVDEELAALVGDIKSLGGSRLFQYVGEDGKARPVTPRDVNDYIKAAAGAEFSAKDFRTWGGTLLTAVELAETGCCEDARQAKKSVVAAVKRVAERLGNTPTVCRSCYIHPKVLEAYERGRSIEEFRPRRARRLISGRQPEYTVEELALLKLLRAKKNGGGGGENK